MLKKQYQNILAGMLPVCKEKGKSSFSIVAELRKITRTKKIGHSGTLDPFASGVMLMLIGREHTKKSDLFLKSEKEYEATVKLGFTTKTLDLDSPEEKFSEKKPSFQEIENALKNFQGEIWQKIPMYSAKKIKGTPLYKLARKGLQIETGRKKVFLKTRLLSYSYPFLQIHVICSSGTYIRQIAEDLGAILKTGAYLTYLNRTRLGEFHLSDCVKQKDLFKIEIKKYLIKNKPL